MDTQITIEVCNKEHIQTIVDGINHYNWSKVPALSSVWIPLEFMAKDSKSNVIGGILGGIGYWNGLEIKILWVDEAYRGKGIGTRLLQHAENFAQEKGAEVSMLDTFDFQAEGFYIKNGYKPIGELEGFPKGHKRIYFSKKLIDQRV